MYVPLIGGGSGDVPVVLSLCPPVMGDLVTLSGLTVLATCHRRESGRERWRRRKRIERRIRVRGWRETTERGEVWREKACEREGARVLPGSSLTHNQD
jgi:hypothetical protein